MFSFVKLLFLILLLLAVKMEEEEYCNREDSKNSAIPFRPLEKGIVHFIEL